MMGRFAGFKVMSLHWVAMRALRGRSYFVLIHCLDEQSAAAILFNFRTAAISCTAIPLSLLAAVIALDKMGMRLNTMTVGGLSIAIGEVVDDAVIDGENIYRRLRENRALQNSRSTFQVVLDALI